MNLQTGSDTMIEQKGVMDFYADFVRCRKAGQSGEQAWNALSDDVRRLDRREVMRLMTLIRVWESTDGCAYRAAQSMPPHAMANPDDNGSPSRVIRRITPRVPRTSLAQTGLVGPQPNSVSRRVLNAVHSAGLSTFSDDMALYFHVAGYPEPLRIRPYRAPMLIGRYAPESSIVPDINLEPYGAAQCGMSRLHAELCRQGNTLVISDMNSVNHTYVNGEQLSPKETRVMRDGDELRFGTLVARVQFGRA
ncbi:MAG TPA: FHA domain-containing protein [Aggregatilinea sp.]|uniref:FHA domain-containing protein n=1 Tax=Aggregatilinea sp. TaxID=2806333 RepID=UPI002C55E07B|nr:FHA domain-containing protein [Aggregatilinea sp.]HML23640.1 FHA domain-containing protein [Aggregatilinea sp.]